MDSPPDNSKRVRIAFALLIPFLFVQFFFAKYVEEPYPGFVFPLFGGVNGKDGIYPTPAEKVYLYAGTDTLESTKQAIFRSTNESYRYYLMRDFLGPETPDSIIQNPTYRTWLWKNLTDLTQRNDLTGIEVVWIMKYFDSNQHPVVITSDTTGIFKLSFSDEERRSFP